MSNPGFSAPVPPVPPANPTFVGGGDPNFQKLPTYEEAMGEPTIPPYQSQEYGFHSVIEQPTTMLLVTNLGPDSSYIFCPNCQQQVVTRVDYESGAMTWIFCAAITILTGPFGCCLIPFCIDGCKDVGHYCPVCDARIGSFRRI